MDNGEDSPVDEYMSKDSFEAEITSMTGPEAPVEDEYSGQE